MTCIQKAAKYGKEKSIKGYLTQRQELSVGVPEQYSIRRSVVSFSSMCGALEAFETRAWMTL